MSMKRTTNIGELCFVFDILKNQQFMYAIIISILIFLIGWATFALHTTSLANAQTNSKSNITITNIGGGSSNSSNIAITHGMIQIPI